MSNKGAKFEREVCVKLSRWVSQGQRIDLFWRTAMSGGRATVYGRNVRQCGDVCAVAPEGHDFSDRYFTEIKHRQHLDIHGLLSGTGNLIKFWRKTCRQAAMYNRIPLMIAKQDRLPAIACCDRHLLMYPPWLTANVYDLHIYRFEDLLKRSYNNGHQTSIRNTIRSRLSANAESDSE
jgi:hypothetical protein